MGRDSEPASERQIALLRELGLAVPPACTVAQASELVGLAQIVRHYCIDLALQVWQHDLSEADLRPVIQSVLFTPELCDEIQ